MTDFFHLCRSCFLDNIGPSDTDCTLSIVYAYMADSTVTSRKYMNVGNVATNSVRFQNIGRICSTTEELSCVVTFSLLQKYVWEKQYEFYTFLNLPFSYCNWH